MLIYFDESFRKSKTVADKPVGILLGIAIKEAFYTWDAGGIRGSSLKVLRGQKKMGRTVLLNPWSGQESPTSNPETTVIM
jgi:hypothetical protein